MKKEILFLLLDKWSDWEAAYLYVGIQMLAGENYCVKTVAIDKKEVISIGGLSWRKDNYDEIKKIINQSLEKKKILGAICDVARFLGTIGVLNNIKHTCNDLHDLKNWAGDKFIPKMAVSDNGVITANGTASLEFTEEVVLSLKNIPNEAI